MTLLVLNPAAALMICGPMIFFPDYFFFSPESEKQAGENRKSEDEHRG